MRYLSILAPLALFSLCSSCQSPAMAPVNTAPQANLQAQNTRSIHQATGVFEYREMSVEEDINIYQVARRFLWKYEPSAVNPEPFLNQLPATYPLRRYEITFSGPDAEQVEHALNTWIELFKAHGGAL